MEHDLVVVAVRAGDVMGRCSRGKMRLDGNQVVAGRPSFLFLVWCVRKEREAEEIPRKGESELWVILRVMG